MNAAADQDNQPRSAAQTDRQAGAPPGPPWQASHGSPPSAVVHDCSPPTAPEGWPTLRVLVLYPPPLPGAAPALVRAAARRLARQLVQQQAGTAVTRETLALDGATRGARNLSFSHEADATLLGWCLPGETGTTGAVGVDLVDLDHLAQTSPRELVATAALYLGPEAAAALAAAPCASTARRSFAQCWAGLEARLKCLGLELDEWRPALASTLASTRMVRLDVKDRDGQASRRWIGCLAWRAGALTGS